MIVSELTSKRQPACEYPDGRDRFLVHRAIIGLCALGTQVGRQFEHALVATLGVFPKIMLHSP